MCLLLVALLLAPQDEEATLKKALSALDRPAVDRAAATLVALNDPQGPPAFASAFRHGLDLLAALDRERQPHAREMEIHRLVLDREGRPLRGDGNKFLIAKRLHDAVAAKMDVLQGALPRLAGQIMSLTSVKGLASTLQTAPDWYVRACCAEALGRIDDRAAWDVLLARAGTEESPGVRVAIADGLKGAALKSPEARALLASWTENGPWAVRLASANTLAGTADRSLAPVFIKMLAGGSVRLRYEVNGHLKTLTGVDKHGEPAAWKDWWDRNSAAFLAGTYVPGPAERADPPGMTMFYGIPIHSDRVVFVVDNSISMLEPTSWNPPGVGEADKPEGTRAIDVARFELRRIIKTLPDQARFNIIAVWGRLTLLGESWVQVTRATRESSLKFLQGLEQKSGTDLFGGLSRALDHSGGGWNVPPRDDSVDTICILSDGAPSVGLMDRGHLVERVLDATRYKKIAIHTVCISGPPYGRELLRKLSDGTGGLHVIR